MSNNHKCTPRDFEKAYKKYQGQIVTDKKFLRLTPRTYIQFSVMVKGNRITYWIDSKEYPKYKGIF